MPTKEIEWKWYKIPTAQKRIENNIYDFLKNDISVTRKMNFFLKYSDWNNRQSYAVSSMLKRSEGRLYDIFM